MTNFLLVIVSFFFTPLALAENTPAPPSIAGTFGSLFAVLALIVFLVWVLKKMRITQRISANSKLKIVSQLAIGQRERLAVIDVNGEQVLIGITATQISLLKTLENPIQPPEPSTEQALKSGSRLKNSPKQTLKGFFSQRPAS